MSESSTSSAASHDALHTTSNTANAINRYFYERQVPLATLQRLQATLCEVNCPTQICWVHGVSGSGKTTLCQSLAASSSSTSTTDTKVLFVGGKQDQFQDYAAPYAAIVQAFDPLGDILASLQDTTLQDQLRTTLTMEASIVPKLIPSFAKLVVAKQQEAAVNDNRKSEQALSSTDNGCSAQQQSSHEAPPCMTKTPNRLELATERLAVAFRSLLRIICCPARPLILFVDDLQWTDCNSRELLKAIVADDQITNFMLLGGYREEQADQLHDFLQSAGQSGEVTDIALYNLRLNSVQALLAHHLAVAPVNTNTDADNASQSVITAAATAATSINDDDGDNKVSPLASLVYRKTNGNPYFVHLLLRLLQRQELLHWNDSLQEWEWDLDQILQTDLMADNPASSSAVADNNSNTNATTTNNNNGDCNVLYVVTQRAQQLSPRVRRILQLAACIGFSVDLDLVYYIYQMEIVQQRSGRLPQRVETEESNNNSTKKDSLWDVSSEFFLVGGASDEGTLPSIFHLQQQELQQQAFYNNKYFHKALQVAVTEELILLDDRSNKNNNCNSSTCQFYHDRVQQCFYEMVGDDAARASLHLRIGMHMLMAYQQEHGELGNAVGFMTRSADRLLFLAADQCNRGSTAIGQNDDTVRIQVIRLNLQASQEARSKAGATLVANFLDKAIGLIRDSDWQDDALYPLVLEVYSVSAEVESAQGKFDRSQGRVESILARARDPQDTIRAVAVQALSLGAQQEYAAALTQAKKALSLLGIKTPPSHKPRLLYELWKTRRLLKTKTESDFLNLPPMKDSRMVLAMRILQMGVIWGWNADIYFGSFSYLIMIDITLTYGKCYLTPFTFSGFGNMLANFLRKEKEAHWYGQIALKMDAGRESIPATTMVTHCYLSHLRLPASSSLEPFLSAYRISLETGDLAMGTICLCNYLWVSIYCGLPLGSYAADMRNFLAELKLCQQDFLLAFLLPDYHLALNLCGKTRDPSSISWKTIHESDLFKYTLIPEEHPADLNLQYKQMFNALVLGDEDKIEKSLKNVLKRKKPFQKYDGSHISNVFFTFWDGLAGLELQRRHRQKKRKYSRLVNESIQWLTRSSQEGSINCVGMLHLLKAEKSSLDVNTKASEVRPRYNDAITQLSKTGFTHYAALANERAGQYMLQNGDLFWAEHYLSRAATLYHEWGASVKVFRLLKTYSFIRIEDQDSNQGVQFSIRARSRYDSKMDCFDLVSQEISSGDLSRQPGVLSRESSGFSTSKKNMPCY